MRKSWPVTGIPLCQVANFSVEDVELALSWVHVAKEPWGRTSLAERDRILSKIAERMA